MRQAVRVGGQICCTIRHSAKPEFKVRQRYPANVWAVGGQRLCTRFKRFASNGMAARGVLSSLFLPINLNKALLQRDGREGGALASTADCQLANWTVDR